MEGEFLNLKFIGGMKRGLRSQHEGLYVQPRRRGGSWGKWGPSVCGEASPRMGVRSSSPPYIRCSVLNLGCPANSRDLGKQFFWDNPWISRQIFRNSEEAVVPGKLGETACPTTVRTQRVRSSYLGAGDHGGLSLSLGTLGSQWEAGGPIPWL